MADTDKTCTNCGKAMTLNATNDGHQLPGPVVVYLRTLRDWPTATRTSAVGFGAAFNRTQDGARGQWLTSCWSWASRSA